MQKNIWRDFRSYSNILLMTFCLCTRPAAKQPTQYISNCRTNSADDDSYRLDAVEVGSHQRHDSQTYKNEAHIVRASNEKTGLHFFDLAAKPKERLHAVVIFPFFSAFLDCPSNELM